MAGGLEPADRSLSELATEIAFRLGVSARTVDRWSESSISLTAMLSAIAPQEPTTTYSLQWASVDATAAMFAVSTKTVRRWISNGWVRAERFGPKLIRVYLPSVLEMGEPLP